MPRKTRKQLVGKHEENNDSRQRERELRALERELRRAWYLGLTQPQDDLWLAPASAAPW